MTQVTVKATVAERTAEALKAAATIDAVYDVLMTSKCTRADMVEALRIATNGAKSTRPATRKAMTAYEVATMLMAYRDEEAYRALPFEEKYAALLETTRYDADVTTGKVGLYIHTLTEAELSETLTRLETVTGINLNQYFLEGFSKGMKVSSIVRVLRVVNEIEHFAQKGDKLRLMEHISYVADGIALAILVKRTGLNVGVRTSYYDTEVKEALIEHYTTIEATSLESLIESESKVDVAVEAVKEILSETDGVRVIATLHELLKEHPKSEMTEIAAAITGQCVEHPTSWNKDQLAMALANEILHWRKCKTYRARPYEERYAELLELPYREAQRRLKLMSHDELTETGRRLGVRTTYTTDAYLRDRIRMELGLLEDATVIETLAADGELEEVEELLKRAGASLLRFLATRAGISVKVPIEQYPRTWLRPAMNALMEYYSPQTSVYYE